MLAAISHISNSRPIPAQRPQGQTNACESGLVSQRPTVSVRRPAPVGHAVGPLRVANRANRILSTWPMPYRGP